MRKYESIIIFRPEQSDAQVKTEMKRFEGILQGKGVKTPNVDVWGKRDIAYVVKKSKTGKFVCLRYETDDHSAVEALTSILRISDSVLKYQSYRINEKVRKFKGNPKRTQRFEEVVEDYNDVMEVDY
jgi:small subunit ribosomal protein S6